MNATDKATFTYSGRDNLVAMREAHRYNAYLHGLIVQHAPPSGTWLDFGAGGGQFAIPLQKAGNDVVALEVDPVLAASIAAKGVLTRNSLDEVAEESISYVYTLNVLEHISDDAQALRHLYRKLKPGGKLLIYVPAFQQLYSSMDTLVGHYRRYEKGPLREMVAKAGFTVESAGYADSLGYFASLVYKWLPQRDGTITPGSVALYDRWAFPISRLMDRFLWRWLGKNVYLVARKPS
jgi:SAM-dependent methyltransferase